MVTKHTREHLTDSAKSEAAMCDATTSLALPNASLTPGRPTPPLPWGRRLVTIGCFRCDGVFVFDEASVSVECPKCVRLQRSQPRKESACPWT
jgi:hypothetical protein